MYERLRPLLFWLDPEDAHSLTLTALRLAQAFPPALWLLQRAFSAPEKPVEAFGLRFKNPVGLAAGYDKDGLAVRGLAALGFGHIEIGTVTPRPQPGNPRPRVFRLVEDEAVVNRMGFPGRGMEFVSRQFSVASDPPSGTSQLPVVVGVNLGKNKDTPLGEAASDYIELMKTFAPLADYLAVNVSSPNTVGLRRLQGREMLEALLKSIDVERAMSKVTKPILVKLAPDLGDEELEDALGVILDSGMDGVIAVNTTLARAGLRSQYREESGGLSGSPLRVQSEALLAKIVRKVDGRVPVVSVGGIMSPEDAKRRLDMGAALVQVYTGLVYRGPGLVKAILEGLASAS
ncbi:MAG: quinone-dependent dihydroorotate dehydrogenase [Chloroflexota bacterium]